VTFLFVAVLAILGFLRFAAQAVISAIIPISILQ